MPDTLAVVWGPRDSWPDCLSTEARETWHEVTERVSDYFLNVLPPKYFRGGFACSEPVCYDSEAGAETFQCFVRVAGRPLTRVCTLAQAEREGELLRFAHGL